jgi:hypothetical protein
MATLVGSPPPPVVTAEHGGGSDWVLLLSAKNDIDAHLLEGRLNEAGIEVRAIKDRSGPSWLLGGSDPWSPVAIWVQRFQYEDSRIALAELAFDAPDEPSPRTERPGWAPVTWWAVAIALGLLFTGIGLARSADHIDRCGLTMTCEAP